MKFTEKHPRTIVKVITFRILFTLSHLINGLIVTGSLLMGAQIAGAAAVINSILYWIHERLWNIAPWNRREDAKINFNEGNPRSISKTLTWRVVVTSSNFLIPYFITGSFGSAVLFAGIATAVNMFLCWAHERVWNRIAWDKVADDK